MLFEDAVILGAATDAVLYHYKSPGGDQQGHAMHNLPFSTIERTVRYIIYEYCNIYIRDGKPFRIY